MENYTQWVSRVNSDMSAKKIKAIVLIDDIYGEKETILKLWDRRNLKEVEAAMKALGIRYKRHLTSTYEIENYSENVFRLIDKLFEGESA